MKKLVSLVLFALAVNFVFAQSGVKHKWEMTLKVVDESGNPVAGANATVGYFTNGVSASIEGLTNTNGIFAASHLVGPSGLGYELVFAVEKNGYYRTWRQVLLGPRYASAGWNRTMILTLRKIGHPIPMYAREVETKIPMEDKPLGFDLTAGDWTAPYGKGKTADMYFTVHRNIINPNDYDAEMTMTFPNKGDGITVAPREPMIGSSFTTSRIAADTGYESKRVWDYSNTSSPSSVFGYFIRVRTVLDANGDVKSALYGKISGDIHFYVGTRVPLPGIGFTYCLNPTPDDRNMEFDPRHNLLVGVPSFEQVREP